MRHALTAIIGLGYLAVAVASAARGDPAWTTAVAGMIGVLVVAMTAVGS